MNKIGNFDPDRIESPHGVELWVTQMSDLARSKMAGQIIALVWPYRQSSSEYLAVEMLGRDGGEMSITFLTGQPVTQYSFDDLETTCFEVVDMNEALAMVDRFLGAAGATTDPKDWDSP